MPHLNTKNGFQQVKKSCTSKVLASQLIFCSASACSNVLGRFAIILPGQSYLFFIYYSKIETSQLLGNHITNRLGKQHALGIVVLHFFANIQALFRYCKGQYSLQSWIQGPIMYCNKFYFLGFPQKVHFELSNFQLTVAQTH